MYIFDKTLLNENMMILILNYLTLFFFRWERACTEENFYKMGEFSLSPYQLPNYWSLHRFARWQISHQIIGNSFRRTPAQTHQGQNANSLPGKCGQSLKFSLWAKGPIGKYGGPWYCGWACPFDPGSYLDHYSSLPNPGHYYGKNFDLIQFFFKFWCSLYTLRKTRIQ